MKIAIATCRVLPEPDPDEPLLLKALNGAGHDAAMVAWDDDQAPSHEFDVCVLRSTWNYYRDFERFTAWLETVAQRTLLLNPLRIVRGNLHKRYLDTLAARRIEIIPTVFFDQGERTSLGSVMDRQGWSRCVIKPAVSAASYQTMSFTLDQLDAGQQLLDEILTTRDAMVQRYMNEVESSGERCLVWIDGAFTHSIRKEPRFADGVERVSDALPVDDALNEFGRRVLGDIADDVLYARVDVMQDEPGAWRLSELELIEPSLFLMQHPPALDRLVAAITRHGEEAGA